MTPVLHSPCSFSLLHEIVDGCCLQDWCSSTFLTARHRPFREPASCSSPCCCSSCCPSATCPSTAGIASSSWPTASAAPTPPQPTSQPTCWQASSLGMLHSVLPLFILTTALLPDGLLCDFTLVHCLAGAYATSVHLRSHELAENCLVLFSSSLACPLDAQAVGTTLMQFSDRSSTQATTLTARGLTAQSACDAHFRLPLVNTMGRDLGACRPQASPSSS